MTDGAYAGVNQPCSTRGMHDALSRSYSPIDEVMRLEFSVRRATVDGGSSPILLAAAPPSSGLNAEGK